MEMNARDNEVPPEVSSLLTAMLSYGSDSARLLELELKLSLAYLPRIAALVLGLPVLLLLCWLGLSASIAGLLYELSDSITVALLGFTGWQAIAFALGSRALKRMAHAASFPRSRRCLKQLWTGFSGSARA